ncbi:MAG: S49 family peptidase [Pseudomonadota bacterium]
MAHELDRVIEAFASRPWAIEPTRGAEIAALLALRHARGPRAEPYREDGGPGAGLENEPRGRVAVLSLHAAIVPRASAVKDASTPFVAMDRFTRTFTQLAEDRGVGAIVLDIDSPGGMIDLVPEAAALVADKRREGRPIYAVANTMMCSAAYWIGCQADRVFATPSGLVGSIGVRAMHMDHSQKLKRDGIQVTHLFAAPRKAEGNPHSPLDGVARAALQDEIDRAYGRFVAVVAATRGVPEAVVRADPEKAERHMGGGRAYDAERALALGMIDEIATLDAVIGMATRAGQPRRSVAAERARLALG